MTIFRPVYVLGIRTHYFNAVAKELDGQIIRNLTTRGYHHAIWIFELYDIENALNRDIVSKGFRDCQDAESCWVFNLVLVILDFEIAAPVRREAIRAYVDHAKRLL